MLHETVLLNADAVEELTISKVITHAKTVVLENYQASKHQLVK